MSSKKFPRKVVHDLIAAGAIVALALGCRSSEKDYGYDVETKVAKSEVFYGEPSDGIQVGLSYEGIGQCGGHQLLVHVRNAGDKPVTIVMPRSLRGRDPAFEVIKNGQPVPREDDSAYMTRDEGLLFTAIASPTRKDFITLTPGQAIAEHGSFSPWLGNLEQTASMSLSYVYENPWAELWIPIYNDYRAVPMGRVGPLWAGEARSGRIEFTVTKHLRK